MAEDTTVVENSFVPSSWGFHQTVSSAQTELQLMSYFKPFDILAMTGGAVASAVTLVMLGSLPWSSALVVGVIPGIYFNIAGNLSKYNMKPFQSSFFSAAFIATGYLAAILGMNFLQTPLSTMTTGIFVSAHIAGSTMVSILEPSSGVKLGSTVF